ncbi:MAG: coenzyme F420-0:L-glutamate ligase [bacterium]|nr:coenzyme F420-0:L-glutamate ligase [bacterium]
MNTPTLMIKAIAGIPLIQPNDDLAHIIVGACLAMNEPLQTGDVLVISSKIISKSENRFVDLREVTPSDEAITLATETRKDPRIVELVLSESKKISRKSVGVLVTQHNLGFISANAGIDQSNVGDENKVLLLPQNPDSSAQALRTRLADLTGATMSIVISDTHGRPFRMGNVGVAIGVAGLPALVDLRGTHDLFGRELKITVQGYADLIASAAHLVCGEGGEGLPVILIRGLDFTVTETSHASDLYRPPEQDLYA